MIGRITNEMTSQMVLAGIQSDLDQLDTSQEELSTGLSINEPSDNPSGEGQALQLTTQLSNLTTYSNNVTDGTGWTDAATSALSDMTSAVQTVQELVEEVANGSTNASEMSGAVDEVNGLIDQVKSDADTQYNGQYVFSGSATGTQPYQSGSNDTYAGNTGSVTREVGPGSSVTVNVNLSSVLGNGQTTPEHPAQHRRRHAVGQHECADRDRPDRPAEQPELARGAVLERGWRNRPPADGVLTDRVASEHHHGHAVQHRGRQHGGDRNAVLERAGGVRGRSAERRRHRSGVAHELPRQQRRLE
jgi:flagellar hook-associated protein 3